MIVGVRHAEVWNPQGLVYATLPGFRLSTQGRSATEALARTMARAKLVAVHASPLERAAETASILAAPHGLSVVEDGRLVEWAFWRRWEGMPWTEIRRRDPDLLDAYAADPGSACPEEPLEEAGRRVLAWAAEAETRHPDGMVLGVTHEAPLAAALLVGGGAGLAGYHRAQLPHLATVRLRPGPPERVDLVDWARAC